MSRALHAHVRSVVAITAMLFACLCFTAADGSLAKKKALQPIHVRGTVYTFDNQAPIAGATVRVAELPGVSAQTGPDGSYDLLVSDGTRFTPYADAVGHHRIYLQTYVSQGEDLERVNFQMPSDTAYNLLALILSVPRDANNELVNCAVVSTFSTVNVRDRSFNDFAAYGAHGVAGATASASPALPNPTYFTSRWFRMPRGPSPPSTAASSGPWCPAGPIGSRPTIRRPASPRSAPPASPGGSSMPTRLRGSTSSVPASRSTPPSQRRSPPPISTSAAPRLS
jgi:hypothetical protein